MTEEISVSEAISGFIRASGDLSAAWHKLEPMLPEATGPELVAVQNVRAAAKRHSDALLVLTKAMLFNMSNKPDA